ncbi:hypothetical protein GF407_20440 [candidate division KSB1 bacterium]|nr:hypothetical protein [candidate division KSB1 bacterium]
MGNSEFKQAMKITHGATFAQYLKSFGRFETLSEDEKKDLNEKLKSGCMEIISLLRKAYKNEPKNPEISFELVKIFHVNQLRIVKIGERSELLDAVRTGFKADDGKQIMGYPDMILYHAERCKENDPGNKYSEKLDRIVDIYKRL